MTTDDRQLTTDGFLETDTLPYFENQGTRMPFKFEKLEIWKAAVDMADKVHLLTGDFPKEEMFSLTS